jgi:adenosine deaminase
MLQQAVEVLELDEVQHGIAAAESKSVMRFLADHRIRMNLRKIDGFRLSLQSR